MPKRQPPPEMSPDEAYDLLRDLFGVETVGAAAARSARRWKLHPRTPYKWMAGERSVQPVVQALIHEALEVKRLEAELAHMRRQIEAIAGDEHELRYALEPAEPR